MAYEAFWWNCVMVKANDLDARCPFGCSGTPAATYGCAEGEADADRQVTRLLSEYSSEGVRGYLRTLAMSTQGKEKIKSYFP
jgi:hypothetical protein